MSHFYPRPPRGGRRGHDRQEQAADGISIHALREEGDDNVAKMETDFDEFLSTPSARRATFIRRLAGACVKNFYPRPPRGGRLPTRHTVPSERGISIHALREEGDAQAAFFDTVEALFLSTPSARRATSYRVRTTADVLFLSTPSARRATEWLLTGTAAPCISIHALREEGDQSITE